MRILSIDTASRFGSVALSDGDRLITQLQYGGRGTHSEHLLLSIDNILVISGFRRDQIEAVAIATGPGSFTGLRVGCAAAKGMALALACPVAGVSSLLSLALNARGYAGTIVTLIDARRGEIYAAGWVFGKTGRPKAVICECVLPPEALIRRLKEVEGKMILVGDGAIEYGGRIRKEIGTRVEISAGTQCLPQAVNLAILSLPDFVSGKRCDLETLIPNYIRRSDAEIGFRGRPCK